MGPMARWHRIERSPAPYGRSRGPKLLRRAGRSRHWYRKAHVHWWLHLVGWLAFAVVAGALLGPWASLLGIVIFEAALTALVLRRSRHVDGPSGRHWPGGGMGGVREPRRPLPTSGAGAAVIPH
jgi:hypothetical protein